MFSLVFRAEKPADKTIILCFNDGPRPQVLEKLLPVLEKYKVPGTFFVMGCVVPENKKIVIAESYTVMKHGNPDINTEDYLDFEKRHSPKVLIERVKKIIADREVRKKFEHVLVFHELNITVSALKTLIPYFQNQGYKFARLDEMFPRK